MELKKGVVIKNVIVGFLIFITGFIGSILIISKKSSDMTTAMLHAQTEINDQIQLFGISIMEFKRHVVDGVYVIDIIKISYYDYIPFFVGFALLAIALLITVITKYIIKKYKLV